MDILYLQSSSLTEKQNITELTQFKARMDMGIGNNQREIAKAEKEIISLESQINLSSPTEIISPACLPEFPVKPQKKIIVIIGAALGLLGSSLFVFFREYMKN